MTYTSRAMLALLVTISSAACMAGPSATSFQPVRKAGGVHLLVSGRKSSLSGELLEVRENELVVLEDRVKKSQSRCMVTVVALSEVRDAHFNGIRPKWGGGMPTETERAELRLLSRFPAGITPPIMHELLSCSNRTEPEVVPL